MRIARYLASCGLGSRRYCEELVTSGKVRINDQVIETPALNIVLGRDLIKVDDQIVQPKNLVYYVLNKPTGYTTTRSDPHADKIVTNLLPKEPPVWPVGRLDKETSGLLLLTNDGLLTFKMTHPKYQKEKEYLLETDKPLTDSEIDQIQNGVELDDGWLKPDSFKSKSRNNYQIIIHEGRKRLIRRLITFFNKKVVSLHRVRIDSLKLGSLGVGQYKVLTRDEIERLFKNV